jgi:hypothetical protein
MLLNPYRFESAPPVITYDFTYLNPNDKSSNLTLSGGNLTAVRNSGSGWASVRSAVGKNKGKWYFEVLNNANGSTDGDAMWGFMRNTDSLATYPGNSSLGTTSMGWEPNLTPNSAKFQNGSLGAVSGYGRATSGQYSYFAIDLDAGKLWVKNSSGSGWAGGGDPAAGSSPTFTFTANLNLYVTIGAFSNPQSATVNFGATSFNGSVPSGFNAGWYAPSIPISPSFDSRITMTTETDAQGVATDGTNLWFSSSDTIFKYSKAGSLITSRDVSGDNPTGKSQINGMYIKDGVLYVSAAENSTPRKSYIVQYDPDTLAYIDHNQITGDWFSEDLSFKDGYWWVVFHANKVVAKVDPDDWSVVASYDLTFAITGSSGGYGSGTGYDGVDWYGDYLLCNIHEIYDQDFLDVYFFDGTSFIEVGRLSRPTSIATQGIAIDPSESDVMWFAERNYSGDDSIAKVTI